MSNNFNETKKTTVSTLTVVLGIICLALIACLAIVLIGGNSSNEQDTITVSEDGYLVVNGVKTDYEVRNREHSFGAWSIYGNTGNDCAKNVYYRVCSDCSEQEWKIGSYEDHDFTNSQTDPTCFSVGYETKTCKNCTVTEIINEIPMVEHTYSDSYQSDGDYHWQQCEVCQQTNPKNEHTIGENGACSVCGALLGATEGVVYDVSLDGSYAVVVGYDGNSKSVIIAESFDNLPVKEIYSNAFKSTAVTLVIVPDTVTSIGEDAFYGCSALTKIVIGSNVQNIGKGAFQKCERLKSIIIPDSVITIGEFAFYGCSNLEEVVIGNSVESIGDSAFQHCKKLTEIVIPTSVISIGKDSFKNCHADLYTESGYAKYVGNSENPYQVLIEIVNKNMSTYNINENTQVIAYAAFKDCKRLANIVIPEGIVGISARAFYECTALENIVIPKSLKQISGYAFVDSTIANVYYAGSEADKGQIVIKTGGNDHFTKAHWHYNYEE